MSRALTPDDWLVLGLPWPDMRRMVSRSARPRSRHRSIRETSSGQCTGDVLDLADALFRPQDGLGAKEFTWVGSCCQRTREHPCRRTRTSLLTDS